MLAHALPKGGNLRHHVPLYLSELGHQAADRRVTLRQGLGAADQGISVSWPDDQAKGLQQAADLPIQLDADLDQTVPDREQGQALVRGEALGGDGSIPPHAQHFSQGKVAPVSSPTRTTCGAARRSSVIKRVGSAATLPSKVTAPLPSITQTLISFRETSSATYCSMAVPPEMVCPG
ncbi:hypothetical protein [Belnapia rosea]|uniref:hypothetical protein n=1 Tax=Belnapia rosea TaxID=938405 RepID=UPI0015A3B65A|nr:hypothetical protein [Belnapia rosea]